MSNEPGEDTLVDVELPPDAELFDSATETTAETPKVEDTPVEETVTEQPRDEQGKFAKVEAPKVEAAVTPPADDDKGQVPSWRVREINAEKAEISKQLETERTERARINSEFQAMQRQMAELRKPAEPVKETKPDPLLDPEGYEKYIEGKMESRFLNERREISLQLAHRTYKDEFNEAYKTAQQELLNGNPALAARVQNSSDPGETLVQWFREHKTMKEVGNDPNAFFEKRLEASLSDPVFLGKIMERAKAAASGNASPGANGTTRPVVVLPPSLATTTRADNSRSSEDNDLSDEGLFKHATR